jgi:hypothetical protein
VSGEGVSSGTSSEPVIPIPAAYAVDEEEYDADV